MRGGCQHNSQYQKSRSSDNASPTSQSVNQYTEEEHSKNLANEIRVGKTGFDSRRHGISVSSFVSLMVRQ